VSDETARVAVIVVAAGSGTRLGHELPKAFVEIEGRTILDRSLDAVRGMNEAVAVVVVVPADLVEQAGALLEASGSAAVVVSGGVTRQRSVALGLEQVPDDVEIVLVHDAARAFTPVEVFERVVASVRRSGTGAVPGLPVADTMRRVSEGVAGETVDRSTLVAVQTPQGFPVEHLTRAYEAAAADLTDDAALVQGAGFTVEVVAGDARAFKITTPDDLHRAHDLLRRTTMTTPVPATPTAAALPAMRTGIGVDAHSFDDAAPLWLAGLNWPGEPGLAGHSDGDVVAHAICDALLGASGLGDLGSLFGTSDPELAGAHGDVFLTRTREVLEAAGYTVGNVSVQLIANRPRFTARKPEADALLTALLGAPVSVTATTTDGLGFTGRTEGATAIATALITRS
jgi:2-C-methyl-D-erythritol 4-phosphate cytidylyltransferase/2-C-methyl-D-erythritol 2,4-cyclodiphosphate synthase